MFLLKRKCQKSFLVDSESKFKFDRKQDLIENVIIAQGSPLGLLLPCQCQLPSAEGIWLKPADSLLMKNLHRKHLPGVDGYQ